MYQNAFGVVSHLPNQFQPFGDTKDKRAKTDALNTAPYPYLVRSWHVEFTPFLARAPCDLSGFVQLGCKLVRRQVSG